MVDFNFSTFIKNDHPQVIRADCTLKGTAPFRAATHCEPFRLASEQGWWIYPPCDFSLKWDGENLVWLHQKSTDWTSANYLSLNNMSKLSESFDISSFEAGSLPAVVALPEPGYVQMWTGLTCHSTEGWCSLVRSVPNFAGFTKCDILEGIIETDWWDGPILLNIRIRETNSPIHFRKNRPIAAIHPLQREVFRGTKFSYNIAVNESSEGIFKALSIRDSEHPGGYARFSRRISRPN